MLFLCLNRRLWLWVIRDRTKGPENLIDSHFFKANLDKLLGISIIFPLLVWSEGTAEFIFSDAILTKKQNFKRPNVLFFGVSATCSSIRQPSDGGLEDNGLQGTLYRSSWRKNGHWAIQIREGRTPPFILWVKCKIFGLEKGQSTSSWVEGSLHWFATFLTVFCHFDPTLTLIVSR